MTDEADVRALANFLRYDDEGYQHYLWFSHCVADIVNAGDMEAM